MKIPKRFLSLLMGLDKQPGLYYYNYTVFCAATGLIVNEHYDDKKKLMTATTIL